MSKKTVGQKVEKVIDSAIVTTSTLAGVASFNYCEKTGLLKESGLSTPKRLFVETASATIIGAGTCKIMQLTKTSIKWTACKIASKFSSKESKEDSETEVQE